MSDNLMKIIERYWAFVYQRQWADWELLAIAAATAVLLLLMIVRRHRRSSGKRKHVKIAAIDPEVTVHQSIRLLQQEIIRRDYTEARLEREVSELASINKQLLNKNAELKAEVEQFRRELGKAYKSSGEKSIELAVINKQLLQKVADNDNAMERSENKVAELTDTNNKLRDKIDELTAANEQLHQEITESKDNWETFRREISGFTKVGESSLHDVVIRKIAGGKKNDN